MQAKASPRKSQKPDRRVLSDQKKSTAPRSEARFFCLEQSAQSELTCPVCPVKATPMRLIPALLTLFALSACIIEDVDTVEMAPRAVAQTEAEIAFVSRLFNDIQTASIAQDREYCGLIGVDDNGDFVATQPRRGRTATCLPPDPAFADFVVVASYHTHGSYNLEYFNEVPSFDDIRTDIEDGTDGYIATPGGRLWYVDARARMARQICGLNCLIPDGNHREDPDDPVQRTYTLDELREY